MGNKWGKRIINKIVQGLISIFIAISFISIATIGTMNMKFIYKIIIDKYNLVDISGVSVRRLMMNYETLIEYLQNPFLTKLQFMDFDMSKQGEIHFWEVKKIFMVL